MEEKMDLRIRKTYLALHNAFIALLEEKSFDDLTVNELCDRAMIRRTTFYKHFGDKYEYFSFFVREMVSTFQAQLTPNVMGGDPRMYFQHMGMELLRFLNLNEKIVSNVRRSRMFPLLISIMLEQITSDMLGILHRTNSGLTQNADKLRGIAAFYAGGVLNALRQLIDENHTNDGLFREIIEECME